MNVLDKIIRKNLNRNGNHILAISISLLDVLLEKTHFQDKLTELNKNVGEDGFVPLPKISEDIKEFLSLNSIVESNTEKNVNNADSNQWVNDRFEGLLLESYDKNRTTRIGQRMVINELANAFKYYEQYKCEFIDSFKDGRLVEAKAQRLSVLMVLRKIMNEKQLIELAYAKLQSLDPKFELIQGGIREFYEQLDWYSRTGEVRGCIIN